jgi:polyhydroxyalkanoate synthesis repressor PhaR
MFVFKKYSNRRLYDPLLSRYVTLEEVAEKIRLGHDVRVEDARTGEDLTQATLAQIIVESRGLARLLPIPLLTQLVRLEDDALAEFVGQYMTWSLDWYLKAKQSVRDLVPFGGMNPFMPTSGGPGSTPYAPSALTRLFGAGWNDPAPRPTPSAARPAPPPPRPSPTPSRPGSTPPHPGPPSARPRAARPAPAPRATPAAPSKARQTRRAPAAAPAPQSRPLSDVEQLRRELDALKRQVRGSTKKRR